MNNLFEINGETYYLDLDEILRFCFKNKNIDNREHEIVENYETDGDSELKILSKTNREIRSNGNEQYDTISYDIVKLLLNIVLDEPGDLDYNENFPFVVSMNTLIKYNFLKKNI